MNTPLDSDAASTTSESAAWRPTWFGSLAQRAATVDDHAMSAVKRSIARGRAATAID